MSTTFPTTKQTLPNPTATDLLENANPELDHDYQHSTSNDTIEALQDKVGVDGSAVTTSHDYKLGEVTGSDKAVGKTATQTLSNKTLTAPQINMGSDATGDMYYRNGSGVTTRLPAGAEGSIISYSGGIPTAIPNPAAADASTTVKGVVEEATQAEVDAGTATGATGARLFVNPSTLTALRETYFGDGSDGDVTITGGTTTLTRDMFYDNLVVEASGVLETAGFKVFVKGTLTNAGAIRRNGNAGGAGVNGGNITDGNGNGTLGAGGTAGAVLADGTIFGGIAGQVGQDGQSGVIGGSPDNYTAPSGQTNSFTGISGSQGGNGGLGSGVSNTQQTQVSPAVTKSVYVNAVYLAQLLFNPTGFYKTAGQAGGGAGGTRGGNSTSPSGNGGGGGGGGGGSAGGIVVIYAKNIINTGTIQANGGAGGNGGNGGNATAGGGGHSRNQGGGGGGGGAGGAGGAVILVYASYTNSGTVQAIGGSAGTAGTGGTGNSAGASGVNGTAGNSGVVIQLAV